MKTKELIKCVKHKIKQNIHEDGRFIILAPSVKDWYDIQNIAFKLGIYWNNSTEEYYDSWYMYKKASYITIQKDWYDKEYMYHGGIHTHKIAGMSTYNIEEFKVYADLKHIKNIQSYLENIQNEN